MIAANSELQERELLKRARLAAVLADALRARGTEDTTARLAAQLGVLAFSTAYGRWAAPDNQQPYPEIAAAVLHEFQVRAAALGTETPSPPEPPLTRCAGIGWCHERVH